MYVARKQQWNNELVAAGRCFELLETVGRAQVCISETANEDMGSLHPILHLVVDRGARPHTLYIQPTGETQALLQVCLEFRHEQLCLKLGLAALLRAYFCSPGIRDEELRRA